MKSQSEFSLASSLDTQEPHIVKKKTTNNHVFLCTPGKHMAFSLNKSNIF